MKAQMLTPQNGTLTDGGMVEVEFEDAPAMTFGQMRPDTLDLAYTALADVLALHLEARIAAEQADSTLKRRKAETWDAVTAECKTDGQRDRNMAIVFAAADEEVLRLRHVEMRANLEVELARLELERTRAMHTLTGVSF